MSRVALRLDLLLVLAAAAIALERTQHSLPGLLGMLLLGLLVVATVDRRAVLELGAAAATALIAGFRLVLVPDGPAPETPRWASGAERGRAASLVRLQSPDVPGKPRARAPGRD